MVAMLNSVTPMATAQYLDEVTYTQQVDLLRWPFALVEGSHSFCA